MVSTGPIMTETEIDTLELYLEPETTCNICYAEFLDPEDLTHHVNQVHTERYTRKCQFCTHTVQDLEANALHIRDEHLCDLSCCKYCNRVFNDYDKYRKHVSKHYMHTHQSKYACANCDMLFTNILELEQHERKSHEDSTDGILLYNLFPILSSVINIKALSFLKSLGDDKVVYVCVICKLQISDVSSYINHLKIKGCRSLVCDRCSSVYKNKKGISRHYYYHKECHNSIRDEFKKCNDCQKMYDANTLREHMKHCQVIKCMHCNIIFDSIHQLSEHQSVVHPSTMHIKTCKFCKKGFVGFTSLEKHIERVHRYQTHLYKYMCVYCKALFKHPKRLFAHFYSTHKDLEPYTCKICDKKFKIRKRFTIHIKLDHKSIGFTEFDENYHVFFSDRKSDKPFKPTALAPDTDVSTGIIEKNSLSKNTVNINSDFMSATETEGNQTEVETEKKTKTLKRKRVAKSTIINRSTGKKSKYLEKFAISETSDEDEPLVQVKRREERIHRYRMRNATWNNRSEKSLKGSKNKFTCNTCQKNCYTYQNYNNHLALHKKNVAAKCVKCSEVFKSKEELNDHYTNEHSTTLLTEKLKTLLEKRKNMPKTLFKTNNSLIDDRSNAEKFKMTIKKVNIPKPDVKATLKPVANKSLSVQNFIENFTPEAETPKRDIVIDTNISIKRVDSYVKESIIKMTKCNLQHIDFRSSQLCLPVRFTPSTEEHHSATIKVVQVPDTNDYPEQEIFEQDSYYDEHDIQEQVIPDVAQEVMLEVSEEPKTIYIPHKVVIPKLNVECKKIRIAHLQPEAPFYKIVKVEEALNTPKIKEEVSKPKTNIKLPDGTKLVSVNPLAHLLSDTSVEKILQGTKKRYYKPKSKDFETAIAKAMLKLKNNDTPPKKKKKLNKDIGDIVVS